MSTRSTANRYSGSSRLETGSYAPQDAASYVLQHDQIIVQMTA